MEQITKQKKNHSIPLRVLINNDYNYSNKKRRVWNNGLRILRIYITEKQAMNLKKNHQHNSKADKCIKESHMEEGYYD